MKVLVADKFEQSGLDGLKAAGCEVIYRPDVKGATLSDAIRGTAAQVLIVRSTEVTGPMLETGALSLIVRAGAGYNTIDVAAASARGIYVSNCPGKNAIAVAELAFGLLLALDRRIPDNVADLRAGKWDKKEYSKARGLYGRTLGLLGFGSIGQEMAMRARAFGMSVVVWSRRFGRGPSHEAPSGVEVGRSPEDVAERADAMSIHLALSAETRGLVNAAVLDRMKPGACLINTSRAEIVDMAALQRAIGERRLRVGLDVFAMEPSAAAGDFADPIVGLPSVYGTHHIGGSTDQAQEAVAIEAVRIVETYKTTGRVPNVVNLAAKTPATHRLVVRHRDRPGVLADVFARLRADNINVQETENVVFDRAEAAVARINIDRAPSSALLDGMRGANADIFDVYLVAI